MKFYFSIKFNLALLLSLTILAVLFLAKKGKYKEGYIGTVRGPHSKNRRGVSNASVVSFNREFVSGITTAKDAVGNAVVNSRETILSAGNNASSGLNSVGNTVSSALGSISGLVVEKKPAINTPKWRSMYGSGVTVPDTITTGLKPDTSLIVTSGCSTKSIVKSLYEEDICVTYAGDYPTLDTKCKALSNDNCNLPACCVLINGTKCVAGDANGPTYLTDQGNEIDYKYYLHRNECYGAGCDEASNGYLQKCGKYANNSTGISQGCMIEMFNKAGCPSKSPKFVINDDFAYYNSKSSKKYVETELTKIAKKLLSDISKGNDDSRIKCKADPNNPCDQYLSNSTNINKACLIRLYNDNGCPNTVPPLVTDSFEDNYRNTTKLDIIDIMKNATSLIKNSADSGNKTTNIQACYGSDVSVSPNAPKAK